MYAGRAEQAAFEQARLDRCKGPQSAGYWRLPLPDESVSAEELKIAGGRQEEPIPSRRHVMLWLHSKDNRQRLTEATSPFLIQWALSTLGLNPAHVRAPMIMLLLSGFPFMFTEVSRVPALHLLCTHLNDEGCMGMEAALCVC